MRGRLVCPRCNAETTHVGRHGVADGSTISRKYKCTEGHTFTTREVPLSCVNAAKYKELRRLIDLRDRAIRRRLYIMRRPEMSDKALAGRLHISPERVYQIRADISGVLGKSRLSPPLRPEDE